MTGGGGWLGGGEGGGGGGLYGDDLQLGRFTVRRGGGGCVTEWAGGVL